MLGADLFIVGGRQKWEWCPEREDLAYMVGGGSEWSGVMVDGAYGDFCWDGER